MRPTAALAGLALCLSSSTPAAIPGFADWPHHGTVTILTTPDGANLPAAESLSAFPVLVRLDGDWFPFAQTRADGADLRFSSADGSPLAFEIDSWDAAAGSAAVWVLVPEIKGNSAQPLHLHWGHPTAPPASDSRAVFSAANGFLSTWHLGTSVEDAAGTLASKDTGTSLATGVVGPARHFPGGKGIFGGAQITNYPSGSAPHTTSGWFRAEKPNTTIIGWGNEGGGRGSKIRMIFQSPPHIRIDSDFSDIRGSQRLPMNEWIHVAHTYGNGPRRLFINGQPDSEADTQLDIRSPSRLWLGGWYDQYDFTGDLDEVRISSVPRTPAWIRTEFENQKPFQSLVGPLVSPGDAFSVSPATATIREGESLAFTLTAGGAHRISWDLLNADGAPTPLAVNRFHFTFTTPRINADQAATLRCTAVTAAGLRTQLIPLSLREAVAEPDFTLAMPSTWDGRSRLTITPDLKNRTALPSSPVTTTWSVEPFAVVHARSGDSLTLEHALHHGPLTITATLSNGGPPVTRSAILNVLPTAAPDPWIQRPATPDEKPSEGMFLARQPDGHGTLHWNGKLANPAARTVTLTLTPDKGNPTAISSAPQPDGSFSLSLPVPAGLIRYTATLSADQTAIESVGDIVCGDAFLIDGQSNAVATDWGPDPAPDFSSPWIRSFGSPDGHPNPATTWGQATYRAEGGQFQIGFWAMELARKIVETHKIPVCFLNGAVGGTRIDQHQRHPTLPDDPESIYGRLLARTRKAGLTHGIRGIFWHQGENDQGADGPTGGFGWETYRRFFMDLAAAWKRDYPNAQHIIAFQIWPKACSMGLNGSDNQLREVQRQLPSAVANLSVVATLGITPEGGCHFPPAGYANLAAAVFPLVQKLHYLSPPAQPPESPSLVSARFASPQQNAITLSFSHPISWQDHLAEDFLIGDQRGLVTSGLASGSTLTLQLRAPSQASTISYLDSASWNPQRLLRAPHGPAALTFHRVPILPSP